MTNTLDSLIHTFSDMSLTRHPRFEVNEERVVLVDDLPAYIHRPIHHPTASTTPSSPKRSPCERSPSYINRHDLLLSPSKSASTRPPLAPAITSRFHRLRSPSLSGKSSSLFSVPLVEFVVFLELIEEKIG